MASVTLRKQPGRDVGVRPPPLEPGDRLTREEFERRYQAMPHLKKAELIEGVVYMPSPVRALHSQCHGEIITCFFLWRSRPPSH